MSSERLLQEAVGWLAAATLLASAVYPAHRLLIRLPAGFRPAFQASSWLGWHRRLGIAAVALSLLHWGGRAPRGAQGQWLLAGLLVLVASSLALEGLERRVPRLLASGLRVSAPDARVPELVESLRQEAEALVDRLPASAKQVYEAQLRARLSKPQPSWRHLLDLEAGRRAALAALELASVGVADEGMDAIEDLRTILVEKLELDAQRALESALSGARVSHAVLSGALLGLVAVHAVAMLVY